MTEQPCTPSAFWWNPLHAIRGGRRGSRRDEAGNTQPTYDFCYLDGAHDWNIDGLAVILVERLLRPGAWLLLDDLDWTYESSASPTPEGFSEEERTVPHVGAVFDVVIRGHPSFGDLRIEDGVWGWAPKAGSPGGTSLLGRRLKLAYRRLARLRASGAGA